MPNFVPKIAIDTKNFYVPSNTSTAFPEASFLKILKMHSEFI